MTTPVFEMRGLSALSENEFHLKAALLVQFAKFAKRLLTSFGQRIAPIAKGIIRSDPMGKAIDDIASGERVVGRLPWGREINGCQIPFVPREESGMAAALRDTISPVLIVGEQPDFAKKDGAANLCIDQRKVRFEISPDRARACDVTGSSRLLALARLVMGDD